MLSVTLTETATDKTASLHITALKHSQQGHGRKSLLKSKYWPETGNCPANAKPEPVSHAAGSADLHALIQELTSEMFAEIFFYI